LDLTNNKKQQVDFGVAQIYDLLMNTIQIHNKILKLRKRIIQRSLKDAKL